MPAASDSTAPRGNRFRGNGLNGEAVRLRPRELTELLLPCVSNRWQLPNRQFAQHQPSKRRAPRYTQTV